MSELSERAASYRKGWNDAKAEAADRIEALEADIAASEHNFKAMRQLRNAAADRIEALEAALRKIVESSFSTGAIREGTIARAALATGEKKDAENG